MNDSKNNDVKLLRIKIIQSGDIIKIDLDDTNLGTILSKIYFPLLKRLKLDREEVYLSNDQGKMVRSFDFKLPLKQIIEKFGNQLNLYYEKVM